MDYTEHPDAKHLKLEKTNEHIPKWYREMEAEKNQFQILDRRGKRLSVLKKTGRRKQGRTGIGTSDITRGTAEKVCKEK